MSSEGTDSHAPYRRDIDGLRALAVTPVVIYHAFPAVIPAGLVGVDIFFVISGYLIGGIIYAAALERRFSFADFYARRARRILPALIAVVTATGVAGLALFDRSELFEFGRQARDALLGLSNMHYWRSTDYFSTRADLEPLLMTWSLGVEEQFYVLFPFAIFLLVRCNARLRMALLCAAAVVSFGLSVALDHVDRISAFYLLPARAWELAAGAALAVAHRDAPHITRFHGRGTDIAAGVALAMLFASFAFVDPASSYRSFQLAVPVIATAILLQTQHSVVNRKLLSAAPLVGIGLISYSWYLWHWPLMAVTKRASDFEPTVATMIALVLVSFVLAVLSWRFIEQPFRRPRHSPKGTLLRYGLALVAAMLLPAAIYASNGLPQRLDPAVLTVEKALAEGRGRCLARTGGSLDPNCVKAGAQVALLGDSHASAMGVGLSEAVEKSSLALSQYSKSSCAPFLGYVLDRPLYPTHLYECPAFVRDALAQIEKTPSIRVVVLSAAWPALDRSEYFREDGARVTGREALIEGLTATARRLQSAGKHVVIVADTPRLLFLPQGQLNARLIPARGWFGNLANGGRNLSGDDVDGQVAPDQEATYALMRDLVPRMRGVTLVDPRTYICPDQRCRFAENTTPLYFDEHHISAHGSRKVDWSPVIALTR